MTAYREMTLDEYLEDKLASDHLARLIAEKQAEVLNKAAESFASEFPDSIAPLSAEQVHDWIQDYGRRVLQKAGGRG